MYMNCAKFEILTNPQEIGCQWLRHQTSCSALTVKFLDRPVHPVRFSGWTDRIALRVAHESAGWTRNSFSQILFAASGCLLLAVLTVILKTYRQWHRMLDWKQRLYAFLLRKVVGPFLDDGTANKLHNSIDFSLQDGCFVLKDVALNAESLSEKFSSAGFSVVKATVQRLEIKLALRENTGTSQSSLAWTAMKLGGSTAKKSLPAVSLVAGIHVCGVDLEIKPVSVTPMTAPEVAADENESGVGTSHRIASYVNAAISSLQLSLKLSNINIKMWHGGRWVSVCLSSVTYNDLPAGQTVDIARKLHVTHKCMEFSDVTVHVGGGKIETVVAQAKGNGRVFLILNRGASTADECPELHRDVEASFSHQLNMSFDASTLGHFHAVAIGFSNAQVDGSKAMAGCEVGVPKASFRSTKPSVAGDEEDLLAITGIMKQYREAYHLTETNQLRGGLLVPSHAYMEDSESMEAEDVMTFDVFWDAQEQSVYDVSLTLKESGCLGTSDTLDNTGSSKTKVRLSLLSVSVKISFRGLRSQDVQQEYVLVTLNDLKVSLLTTSSQLGLDLTVGDFAIEDAQQIETDRNITAAQIDIGSILSFEQVSGAWIDDRRNLWNGMLMQSFSNFLNRQASRQTKEYPDHAIDADLPCFSLHVSADHSGARRIECSLQPLELNARQRSLSNLSLFTRRFSNLPRNREMAATQIPKGSECKRQINFTCHCPSITLSVPLLGRIVTSPLFDRFGETVMNAPLQDARLGLILDTLEFRWNTNDPSEERSALESAAQLKAWRILAFASAPIGDTVSVGVRMQRTDLVLLNARVEVEPCIPISLEFKRGVQRTKENDDYSFPLVPTISSFKARQEDEDVEIEQLMDSKLGSAEKNAKRMHSGAHPQVLMLAATENIDAVISLRIPEILCDLTKAEVLKVKEMLEHVILVDRDLDDNSQERQSVAFTTSIALRIDQISLSLKQGSCTDDDRGCDSSKDRFSCLLAVDTLRAHLLVCTSSMRQMRLLVHDSALYSALHPHVDAKVSRIEKDIQTRVKAMKQRLAAYKEARVSPILFRSKHFTPICNDAPSVLLDVICASGKAENLEKPSFVKKQINLTCYHLTFRYDPDSHWLKRLNDLLPDPVKPLPSQVDETPSMTRVFFALADCSVDYVSPLYFCTPSRTIVRLGDFRCSSNIMVPTSHRQAFALSVGDLCCHVANARVSRAGEDAKLCRASTVFPTVHLRSERKSRAHGITPEALLREEGFIEVLTLDSADAVIIYTNDGQPTDAEIAVDSSLGLLSFSACKDSFRCFSASVGEIQAKFTALSVKDIAIMKKNAGSTVGASFASTALHEDKSINRENSSHEELLLDGYEWTEVNHDPLREFIIPDGDEQVATWYSIDNSSDTGELVDIFLRKSTTFPTRIIHHHFPFRSLADPLSHVSMGTAMKRQPTSRLVVHSLAVKFRFHDGYDWPSDVSEQEKTCSRQDSTFIVVPKPRDLVKAKMTEDDAHREVGGARAAKRVQLLASLLDGDEITDYGPSPFENSPLPEERAQTFEKQAELRRLSRKTKVYLQVSASGMTVKLDLYDKYESHCPSSVLGVSITDMFIADAASASTPVKMLGEWANENEHPRDTRCGILMLKVRYPMKRERLHLPNSDIDVFYVLTHLDNDLEAGVSVIVGRCDSE
jgi:hypothetical protein